MGMMKMPIDEIIDVVAPGVGMDIEVLRSIQRLEGCFDNFLWSERR